MKKIEIFSYQSGKESAYAASHYFETPNGIFLFDGQLLIDQAEELMLKMKEDIPSEQLSSVIITSPNPEHYAALAKITATTGAKVLASKSTEKNIAAGAAGLLTRLKAEYGPRAADEIVLPVETIRASQQFQWPDLALQFLDLGVRRSAGNLVCYIPQKQRLITGDLVFNKVHPFIEKVDIDSWIRSLEIMSTLGAKTVYPGHGPVSGGDILTHLKRYLTHFRIAVSRFVKTHRRPDDEVVSGVLNLMTDKYPEYEMPDNLVPGIVREFGRQGGRKAA